MSETYDEAVTGYDVTRAVARMGAADWPVCAMYQISHAAWFDHTHEEDRRYSVSKASACIRAWIRELPEDPDYVPDRPADGQGDRLLWLAMSHLAEAHLRATSIEQGMDEVSEGVGHFLRKERISAVATFLAEADSYLQAWWEEQEQR